VLLWIISQNSWYIALTAVEFWAWLGIESGAALDTCRIGRFCIYPLISFRDLDIVGFLVVGVLVQRNMSTGRNCIASGIGIWRDKFGPLLQRLPNNLRLRKSTYKASKTPHIIDVFRTVSCRASASLNPHCHTLYDRFLELNMSCSFSNIYLYISPYLPPTPSPPVLAHSPPISRNRITPLSSPPHTLPPLIYSYETTNRENRILQNFPVLSRGLQGMSG